jgi:hypothetical protein
MIPYFLQKVSPTGREMLRRAMQPGQPMDPSISASAEMEGLMVQLLASFADSPGWEDTLSLVNEHYQTLAHLAVLFRYTTLLAKVCEWGINVDVQDVNGFTALHCAYLCGDLDSVRILRGYGVDEDIQDCLGRRPLDMYIPRENSSPSSDRTSSSVQIPSVGDDWDRVSMVSSQPGSFSDYESSVDIPASGHQQLHAGEPTTSSTIVPALIPMPSPACRNSFSTDGGWIDRFSELDLTDSPISASLEHSPLSTHLSDGPAAHLCPSSSGTLLPAEGQQGIPSRLQDPDHSYPSTPSSNPTPAFSVSGARAQPSRGPEATSSQGGVRSDDSSQTSPPQLLIPLIRMPVPSPSQYDNRACPSPSLLDAQTAHCRSDVASFHHINPCPETKAGLTSWPATRPSSAGPPTTQRFSPPPHPPPAASGSDFTSTSPPVDAETELPPYGEGAQKVSDDKKWWPSRDEINEPETSKGGPVMLSTEKGEQRFVVLEGGKLVVKEVHGNEKRTKPLDVYQLSRLRGLRHAEP